MEYNINDYGAKKSGAAQEADAHTTQPEQGHDLGQKLMTELNFSPSCGAMPRSGEGGKVSIENEGVIRSANLDKGWQRGDTENAAFRKLTNYHPNGDESTTISLVQPGAGLSKDAAEAFHRILTKNAQNRQDLSAEDIRSLEGVLNKFNAGDNQHTNSAPAGDRYAPIFHLDHCHVEQVDNKPVLVVEGNFVNNDGSAGKVFKGVLVDRDGTGSRIQALTFETENRTQYQNHLGAFDKMVQSIKWVNH